jgi:hypothetical protein
MASQAKASQFRVLQKLEPLFRWHVRTYERILELAFFVRDGYVLKEKVSGVRIFVAKPEP